MLVRERKTRVRRPVEIDGDIARVPLTRGFVAIIDASDLPLVEGWNWCASVGCGGPYAVRSQGARADQAFVLLHRVVMGNPLGLQIDHRDGDTLNNRRANLRLSSSADNSRNRRLPANNTSGYKGVCWQAGRWQSSIGVNRKQIYLGRHDSPEEAHAAYCAASTKYHGEFGRGA
jgi:HNH endonuclease/AP2 domain